jgi:hypothetical protein
VRPAAATSARRCVTVAGVTVGAEDRVAQRLREDAVIWLTTVAANGTPQPNPVWFLWDGHSVLGPIRKVPTASPRWR